MGILDDYLNGSDTPAAAPVAAAPAGGSVINQYMSAPDDRTASGLKKVYIVKPPISDLPKDQSDAINADPGIQGGTNPRDGALQLPARAIGAVGSAASEGVSQAAQGVGDVLSNSPATGVGEIGSGLASIVSSPFAGVHQLSGDVLGAPNQDVPRYPSGAPTGQPLLANPPTPADAPDMAINALPVASTYRAVKSLSTTGEAFRKLVEDIGPDKAAYVAREMKANPNLAPADLSDSVRQGVQRLYANVEGPHVNYIGDVTKERLRTAATDLQQRMNTNLGNVVDPVKKIEELKQNIREVGKTQISPAIAGSKPVNLSAAIKKIDEVLNPGVSSAITNDTILADPELEGTLKSLRKYLTDDKSVRIDPEQLNRLQSAFRKKAETLQSTKPELSKAIYQVRNNIVDAIDEASGGKYKPALQGYRDEYQIQDAFEHGHDSIMSNGRKLEDRPEVFEKWVKDATDPELQAAKEGARIAYDTQMNAFKHAARRGTDIGDVDFNRRRMSALFGDAEAKKMFKDFEDAKKIADTNNKLVQGSQTQMRNAQNTYFEPHNPAKASNPLATAVAVGLPIAGEVGSHFLGGPIGAGAVATGVGMGVLKVGAHYAGKAKNSIIKKMENERNATYSKFALPTQGPDRDELIKGLEAVASRQSPKLSLNQKASLVRGGGLSRLVSP